VKFGSRIADERKRAGLSQQAIAERCGVSREMWGKYERDVASPGGDVLAKAAAAGLDVLYILTGRAGTAGMSLSPEQHALLDNYQHCAVDDQAAIRRLASTASEPNRRRRGA